MRRAGQNVLHLGAVQWYYDLMAERGPGVPEAIVRHVRRCLVCRRQIRRLQKAVTGAGGETRVSRSEMKRDVIETLSLHFGCLEERVTCARVKPFLPGLLRSSARIRIPTPITVHVDHCPECTEDLKALRDLALSEEQLERVEQLYGHEAHEASWLCWRAGSKIGAFIRGALDSIDGGILDHLCTCPRCRVRVYRRRQKLLGSKLHNETGPTVVCRDDIPTAQLFDYAVPYGRADCVVQSSPVGESCSPAALGWGRTTPEGAGATGVRVPQDHVRTCRSCLQRIQELDETIYGIAERTDSGVATVYSTAKDAQEIDGSFADPYPGYPIHVQVIRGAPERVAAPTGVKAILTRTTCNPQVRFLLKTAAIAAVIPLVFLLFKTTVTSGITLAQVVKAFEKAENIHVSYSDPVTGQLIQEFWISRPANLILAAAGQERTLYDLGAKKADIYRSPGASADTRELFDLAYAKARRLMDSCLGFTLDDIPRGATWTRVDAGVAENSETYELAYSVQAPSGDISFYRWRIAVDRSTSLPKELQGFLRASGEDEWSHMSRTQCQYPAEDEMATIVRRL